MDLDLQSIYRRIQASLASFQEVHLFHGMCSHNGLVYSLAKQAVHKT